jgi:hypothetical protein
MLIFAEDTETPTVFKVDGLVLRMCALTVSPFAWSLFEAFSVIS